MIHSVATADETQSYPLEDLENSIYPPSVHLAFAYECGTWQDGPLKGQGRQGCGPIRTIKGRAPFKALTPNSLYTAKMRRLKERSEEVWLQLINAIPDENLKVAVAKKVWWDHFSDRRWRGLDSLIYEDPAAEHPVIKYTRPDTEAPFADLRITLWRLGYTIQQISSQYPKDRIWTYFSRDDD